MASPKQASKTPGTADVAPPSAQPVAADMMQELKVSGHLMALPAGLFCIVHEPSPGSAQHGGMPGVRISLPPANAQNVEITSFRPDGWLSGSGDAALVRVTRGPAQIMVTIYQNPNQPESAPKLQVRQLLGATEAATAQPQKASAPVAMDVMAHVQTRGDIGVKFGQRLGDKGSGHWIEGFAIAAPQGISPADLSYQAVLGRGWLSPWVEAGEYCGSRGMALPLLGLRVRLTGPAAEHFNLTCEASFVDGSAVGPVGSDETCESPNLAALESMVITLASKAVKQGKAKP
ncbi:MAG: hypothetical protein B7Y73_01750 [Acidocella sp. 35-58-6]|nr:MAG: hypothetical protein B7Y73_01750 [Acidocella sp. 35-58-6]